MRDKEDPNKDNIRHSKMSDFCILDFFPSINVQLMDYL